MLMANYGRMQGLIAVILLVLYVQPNCSGLMPNTDQPPKCTAVTRTNISEDPGCVGQIISEMLCGQGDDVPQVVLVVLAAQGFVGFAQLLQWVLRDWAKELGMEPRRLWVRPLTSRLAACCLLSGGSQRHVLPVSWLDLSIQRICCKTEASNSSPCIYMYLSIACRDRDGSPSWAGRA